MPPREQAPARYRDLALHRGIGATPPGVSIPPPATLPQWIRTNQTPLSMAVIDAASVAWANANLGPGDFVDRAAGGLQATWFLPNLPHTTGPLALSGWETKAQNPLNPTLAYADNPTTGPTGTGMVGFVSSYPYLALYSQEGTGAGSGSTTTAAEVDTPTHLVQAAQALAAELAALSSPRQLLWVPSGYAGSSPAIVPNPANPGEHGGHLNDPYLGMGAYITVAQTPNVYGVMVQGQKYQSADPAGQAHMGAVIATVVQNVHAVAPGCKVAVQFSVSFPYDVATVFACISACSPTYPPDIIEIFGIQTPPVPPNPTSQQIQGLVETTIAQLAAWRKR